MECVGHMLFSFHVEEALGQAAAKGDCILFSAGFT